MIYRGNNNKISFLIFLFLFSCVEHKVNKNKNLIIDILEKKEFYKSQSNEIYEYVNRCDSLTFAGLEDAYGKQLDIFKHEYSIVNNGKQYKTGKWNRHLEPCYPKDSRSEISAEGVLGALHSIWERQDLEAIIRFIDYANSKNWILGDGPKEYTNLIWLSALTYEIKDQIYGGKLKTGTSENASIEVIDKLKGYRGKVIADYLDLKGKVFGNLNFLELELLKLTQSEDPTNPIYNALIGKYTGKQDYFDRAIEYLLDESIFPKDKLPGELKHIDWGNRAGHTIYYWIVSILEG